MRLLFTLWLWAHACKDARRGMLEDDKRMEPNKSIAREPCMSFSFHVLSESLITQCISFQHPLSLSHLTHFRVWEN